MTSGWHWVANRHVIDNLRGAKEITAPSQWVADLLRRDMHINPHVIGWAIDPDEFTPGESYHRDCEDWERAWADAASEAFDESLSWRYINEIL